MHVQKLVKLINDDNEDDEKRYIFVSSGRPVNCKPMTQSNIAQGLSATFLRSNVISRERALNISNSLIRATVVSYAFKCGLVKNIDDFATNFMKHKSKTLQKHDLVKHFAAQQTLKYSMNLYNIFGRSQVTEEKFQNMCEVSESPEVTRTDVAQYVKSLMSEISLETGVRK